MDGTHKLVHWGFVIHGCIDGYSGFLVYSVVANRNTAALVFNIFHWVSRRVSAY
jgi:hypothetical protein